MLPSDDKDTSRFEILGARIREYNKYWRSYGVILLAEGLLFFYLAGARETAYRNEYWQASLALFFILIAPAVLLYRRARDLRRKSQEIYAFRVYQVYKDIGDYLDENLERKTYLNRAKRKLNSLVDDISTYWIPKEAPEPLWEETKFC